jgi:hypothetical protein
MTIAVQGQNTMTIAVQGQNTKTIAVQGQNTKTIAVQGQNTMTIPAFQVPLVRACRVPCRKTTVINIKIPGVKHLM